MGAVECNDSSITGGRNMASEDRDVTPFDHAAQQVVELGNRLLDQDQEADAWDVASGLLAGAVQFWLYSRQPCGDPYCDSCAEVSTAEQRLRKLIEEAKEFARDSDYFHSPHDANVGTA
jgi:hypothetical protein